MCSKKVTSMDENEQILKGCSRPFVKSEVDFVSDNYEKFI